MDRFEDLESMAEARMNGAEKTLSRGVERGSASDRVGDRFAVGVEASENPLYAGKPNAENGPPNRGGEALEQEEPQSYTQKSTAFHEAVRLYAMKSAWGVGQTEFFFELSPERVLEAVEDLGYRPTGRCLVLNSYENRVYEVELEENEKTEIGTPPGRKLVAKFYRPGRWSKEQILEEHQFLLDLKEAEIPVVAPISFGDGQTLAQTHVGSLWYAIYPKVGGRVPDELDDEQLHWLGRLLGRIHTIGSGRNAKHRIHLTPETYGLYNLDYLLTNHWIPPDFRAHYEEYVRAICHIATSLFKGARMLRIHGDIHPGNLLWGKEGPFFLDFDDMLVGPAAQDLWLLVPGRDEDSRQRLALLIEGYEQMQTFDRKELHLIEILRALRFVNYTAWLARRWEDPIFPRSFPEFNTHQYWNERTKDLREQLDLIREEARNLGP
jgi:Ser/Thr protein kinase RdoA (MazF antagonist)